MSLRSPMKPGGSLADRRRSRQNSSSVVNGARL
jgi:hypothetical protein